MKIQSLNKIACLIFAAAMALQGCEENEVGPVFDTNAANFVSPDILNAATADAVEFLPENANEVFETIEWSNSDYKVNVSVKYNIEIDNDEDFSSSKTLASVEGSGATPTRSMNVTVKQMNDAMLALGLPGFQESSVFIRVYSLVNGVNTDTLYSDVIERTATTYQSSECGNFCTMGIIGDATPGGWDVDTDMRLADAAKVDKSTWTVTLYLIGGSKVKFRANDGWNDNWGGPTFASGTGTPGGADIVVPTSGYYKATFNDESGEYSFVEAGTATYGSIGLIGAQSDWANDIGDLTQDSNDPHVWTGTMALNAGELKFRANDSWDNNWGAAAYPSGYGIGGGPNINIPVSGTYFVYFNDASGEYFFAPASGATPYAALGIIGSATANGWDSDTDLIKNPSNPYKWSKSITITDGEAKFRADNGWDVNWGASGFPGGVGAQGGANIPVQAGTYFITFNTATGEYYFLK